MKGAPLGFFDSGVGGLTVVREVLTSLPNENIIYLGDTARVPYGSKSPETIRRFSDEDVSFLLSKGVKGVVVACNTASAHALESLQEKCRIPIMGVIVPGVEAVLSDPETERVGIIATRGTIESHAYQHALASRKTGLMIYGVATPLLVPLIEENWIEEKVTKEVLRKYLAPLVEKGIDTLMLACTHYPLLLEVLAEVLPKDVRLIDSATTCARQLKVTLEKKDLLNTSADEGELEIYLTDLSEQFEILANRFLHKPTGRIRRAVLGETI